MIEDIHHIAVRVPDLGLAERFMTDFGLTTVHRDKSLLYMRGASSTPYCYRAELGDQPELVAIAFATDSLESLHHAVGMAHAEQHALDSPGGGWGVSIFDPDGFRVDLVTGVEPSPTLAVREPLAFNTGTTKNRLGEQQSRLPRAPAQVLRLAHLGLIVTDLHRSLRWYGSILGLLPTEILTVGDSAQEIGAFLRVDRGDIWVDHHAIALFTGARSDLQHVAFEVQDYEMQALAHDWMTARGWRPYWGIGRLAPGSHIFDFFYDPFGFKMETMSDGDLCCQETRRRYRRLDREIVRWGPSMPPDARQP